LRSTLRSSCARRTTILRRIRLWVRGAALRGPRHVIAWRKDLEEAKTQGEQR
jgi:hypothetical protein